MVLLPSWCSSVFYQEVFTMENLPSWSSSVGAVITHYTFKVKYCHRVFEDARVEKRCGEIFREVAAEIGADLVELGFDRDHVHFILMTGPVGEPWQIAKKFKGVSAHKLLREFPYLKQKYFWGSGLWSPAYYFESLGTKDYERTRLYVRNQGKKTSLPPDQKTLAAYLN